jgi:hypothetical protein
VKPYITRLDGYLNVEMEVAMAQDWQHFYLRKFNSNELLFDQQETRDILVFFFPTDRRQVVSLEITEEIRSFSQALLIAAVDATYAMGWVEVIFKSSSYPGAGVKKTLQKLGRNASRHWFKNLKNSQSLRDIKIYESVRAQLSRNFRSPFLILLLAKNLNTKMPLLTTRIECSPPKYDRRIWA